MSGAISSITTALRSRGVLLCLRLAVGLVFVVASIDKLDKPGRFVEVIMDYRIVPWSTALVMAIWLSWVELIVGLTIMVGIWIRAGALLLSGLSVVFVVALASALFRGIDLACGCFSVSELTEARTLASLWQEGVLLLGSLWLWIAHWPSENRPDLE